MRLSNCTNTVCIVTNTLCRETETKCGSTIKILPTRLLLDVSQNTTFGGKKIVITLLIFIQVSLNFH